MEKIYKMTLGEEFVNEVEKADYDRNTLQDAIFKAAEMKIGTPEINKMWLDAYLDANAKFSAIKNKITENIVKPAVAGEFGEVDFNKVNWNLNYATQEITVTIGE